MAANSSRSTTTETTTTAEIVQARAKRSRQLTPRELGRSIGTSPTEVGASLPTDLTATGAARVLGCSISTVMRMAKLGRLRYTKDDVGIHRFALIDLEAVRSTLTYTKRTVRTVKSRIPVTSDLVSGDTAAAVFMMFNSGLTPIDVVVGLNVTPAAARRLFAEWQNIKGSVTLDASQYRQVMSILQSLDAHESATIDPGAPLPLADDFVQAMMTLPTRVVKKDATLCDVCLMNGVEKPHRAQRCLGHARKV